MKDDHRSFVSVVQNDSIFKVEKEALFNKQEKWWRWPEKLNLWKYGIGWHIQKEHDKKYKFAKNEPVGANWWRVMSNVMLPRTPSGFIRKCAKPRISAHPKGRKS